MGMAASQARLLCITARIHDVEQQAQAIQNAKIQLATQSDRAYKEYNAALDAQSLTLMTTDPTSGQKSQVIANFKNLASFNALATSDDKNYIITHKDKGLVVDNFIKLAYDDFMSSCPSGNAYDFALFMVTGRDLTAFYHPNAIEVDIAEAKEDTAVALRDDPTIGGILDSIESLIHSYDSSWDINTDDDTLYFEGENYLRENSASEEDLNRYFELVAALDKELFENHTAAVIETLSTEGAPGLVNTDYDEEEFQKYANIFKQIQLCGGCTSIDDYNGPSGNAATDSEFLQNMIEAGLFRIGIVDYDKTTGKVNYEATSPSSDISLSYTNTSDIDNRALKKAEAKYDEALRKINKKDKQYDLDLSKLETERSALTTEYDSVKKVIDENIERTFGIFS